MDSPSTPESPVPHTFARISLDLLGELLGRHGVRALLRRAGLTEWIDAPPQLSLTETLAGSSFSKMMAALEDLYGMRGGRGLGRRTGAALVDRSLKDVGALAGLEEEEFQRLPLRSRARLGLGALRRVLAQLGTMPSEVTVAGDRLAFTLTDCPYCASRTMESAGCSPLLGMVEATLRRAVPELPWLPEETACRSVSGDVCEVAVSLPPASV
jgi:hypothetical protein